MQQPAVDFLFMKVLILRLNQVSSRCAQCCEKRWPINYFSLARRLIEFSGVRLMVVFIVVEIRQIKLRHTLNEIIKINSWRKALMLVLVWELQVCLGAKPGPLLWAWLYAHQNMEWSTRNWHMERIGWRCRLLACSGLGYNAMRILLFQGWRIDGRLQRGTLQGRRTCRKQHDRFFLGSNV